MEATKTCFRVYEDRRCIWCD